MAAYIWTLLLNADTSSLADQMDIIHKEDKYATLLLQRTGMLYISLLIPASFFTKKKDYTFFFFFLFKAILFLNLKISSPEFVKLQQGKQLQLMLNVRETYKYIVKKLNTRIFELLLPNLYLSSYLNAG